MLYKVKILNSFRVALVFPTMFHFLFVISSSCNAILLFQYTMCLAAIYVIVIVQSAGLNSLSTLNFFKEGHVFEILDACIIDTQPLLINSRGQCASQCGMNSLCIAFDYCSLNGFHTCRFRFGQPTLSTTTTQCGFYKITAVSTNLTLIALSFEQRWMIPSYTYSNLANFVVKYQWYSDMFWYISCLVNYWCYHSPPFCLLLQVDIYGLQARQNCSFYVDIRNELP